MIINTIDEAWELIEKKVPIRYSGMTFNYAEEHAVKRSYKGERVNTLALVQIRPRVDGRGENKVIVWAPVEKCEVVQDGKRN